MTHTQGSLIVGLWLTAAVLGGCSRAEAPRPPAIGVPGERRGERGAGLGRKKGKTAEKGNARSRVMAVSQ
jgi:hypothetical protein